jgi:hypothetical protein
MEKVYDWALAAKREKCARAKVGVRIDGKLKAFAGWAAS